MQVLGDAAFAQQLDTQPCVLKAFLAASHGGDSSSAKQQEAACLGTAHISLAELAADRYTCLQLSPVLRLCAEGDTVLLPAFTLLDHHTCIPRTPNADLSRRCSARLPAVTSCLVPQQSSTS